eukprot:UN26131
MCCDSEWVRVSAAAEGLAGGCDTVTDRNIVANLQTNSDYAALVENNMLSICCGTSFGNDPSGGSCSELPPKVDDTECLSVETFVSYNTGGCVGKNELGVFYITLDECREKCLADSQCLSFEVEKDNERCHLSSSCVYDQTAKDPQDSFCFYERTYTDICVTNGEGNVPAGTPCSGYYRTGLCEGDACCQGTDYGGHGWCGTGQTGDGLWGGC